nr:uncharacterized protein I303_01602 [Kwoniella dejecticola CBS 10117]OBR87400.1 hypothetical protein I303_01602 [Kwoniella dejecticola CBS 10117]
MSSTLSVAAERSPDKKPVVSGRSRAASPLFDSRKSALLGLVLGDEASTEEDLDHDSEPLPVEEGEEEVEEEADEDIGVGMEEGEEEEEEVEEVEEVGRREDDQHTVQGPSRNDSQPIPLSTSPPSHSGVTRHNFVSPGKKILDGPAKKSVIRLVLGRKRKAEVDSDRTDREDSPIEVPEPSETPAPEEPRLNGIADDVKEDKGKRLPRKKRKWLKKGEVDPDDPVAVARQKERHRLIDEAIDDLDKQEHLLLDNAHPQLLWLWQELDRRRGLQLDWLEARHQAAIGDLERLRDHERAVTRSTFRVKREDLASAMTRDGRQRIARTAAERTALKRQPASMPSLRGGRGGGGWQVSSTSLLSNGQQRLLPLTASECPFERRDIPRQIQPLTSAEAMADLEKSESHKLKRQHRSLTPTNSRSRQSALQQTSRAHAAHHRPSTNPSQDDRPKEGPRKTLDTQRQQTSQSFSSRPSGSWNRPTHQPPDHKSTTPRPKSPEHIPRYSERPLSGNNHTVNDNHHSARHKSAIDQGRSHAPIGSAVSKNHLQTSQTLGPPPKTNIYDPFGRNNFSSGFGPPAFGRSPKV